MNLRPTQSSIFNLVRSGIELNQSRLILAQQQLATGKRITKLSDDPAGASLALSRRRQAGNVATFKSTIGSVRPVLTSASSQVESASSLLGEARALIIQALNGTLGSSDREALANNIDQIRESLLGVANHRLGDRYLFSGTDTTTQPFVSSDGGATTSYVASHVEQQVFIGAGVGVKSSIDGAALFAKFEFSGVTFTNLTGVQGGTSADSGQGYATLDVRHDATIGPLGQGLAFALGGTADTVLGDHALAVDTTAGTVQLGTGTALTIPQPGDADFADFAVQDADGSELHLDFSGWTGLDFSGTVHGDGSLSLDGTNYQAVTFTDTDLELIDATTDHVVHVDTTGISRAGEELISFSGAANVFDTLAGVVSDLRDADGPAGANMLERLGHRLNELDRNSENLRVGLGQLGARTDRLGKAEARLDELNVHLQGLISEIEDADITSVVLDLTRTEQTLQVAQATGARLIQQSLLNFLR